MAAQITGVMIVYSIVCSGAKKTSKLRVAGLCAGNSPVTLEFPAQRASNAEKIPFDDVIMVDQNLAVLTKTSNRLQKLNVWQPFIRVNLENFSCGGVTYYLVILQYTRANFLNWIQIHDSADYNISVMIDNLSPWPNNFPLQGFPSSKSWQATRAPSQYPKRRLTVRSRKVSEPRDWYFKLSYRFEIWQAHRQQCCRSACQISERSDNSKHKSRGFETLRDLTKRRLFGYWDGSLNLNVWVEGDNTTGLIHCSRDKMVVILQRHFQMHFS